MRKVMIDCSQDIPCNPCKYACIRNAIILGELTDKPVIDEALCFGCAICVANCPGQACFVIDEEYAENLASIDFPYEFNIVPEVGQTVLAVNNQGDIICDARVEKVVSSPSFQKTKVVTISVPKDKVRAVRGMRKL